MTQQSTISFSCETCRAVTDPTPTDRCPNCDGVLAVDDAFDGLGDEFDGIDEAYDDQGRFAGSLPLAAEDVVSLGEGATPLVSAPSLAEQFDVGTVLIKDEGRNPTGSTVDRGLSLAVSAAAVRSRDTVALATTGHAGQSAAAYAGRAGLDSQAFVPTRSSHLTKAMINVHGGDMQVVEGRYPDAEAAFEEWAEGRDDDNWVGVGPASPFRRAGATLCTLELLAQRDWTAPDAIVVPTGHGIGLAGAHAALDAASDRIDGQSLLIAAQPDGCAPIVRAIDGEGHGAWDQPDTIAGDLEIPDPARGREAVAAVEDTDGQGVAVPDADLLAAAVDATAATGVELGTAGGVGVAAAESVAESLPADATLVVLNPSSGSKESDVLRSELMGRGE